MRTAGCTLSRFFSALFKCLSLVSVLIYKVLDRVFFPQLEWGPLSLHYKILCDFARSIHRQGHPDVVRLDSTTMVLPSRTACKTTLGLCEDLFEGRASRTIFFNTVFRWSYLVTVFLCIWSNHLFIYYIFYTLKSLYVLHFNFLIVIFSSMVSSWGSFVPGLAGSENCYMA